MCMGCRIRWFTRRWCIRGCDVSVGMACGPKLVKSGTHGKTTAYNRRTVSQNPTRKPDVWGTHLQKNKAKHYPSPNRLQLKRQSTSLPEPASTDKARRFPSEPASTNTAKHYPSGSAFKK